MTPVKKPAKKAEEAIVVAEAAKAVEKVVEKEAKKAVKKTAAPKKEAVKKEVVKKVAAKKEPVKKTAPKKEAVPAANVIIEFDGKQFPAKEVLEKSIKAYKDAHKKSAIDKIDVYIKPDEGVAYYVVNGKGSEEFKVEL